MKQKKVLVISDIPVFKIRSGNRQSIKAYCELLKSLGAEVSFLLITNHNTNKTDIAETEAYFGKEYFYRYKSNIIEEIIRSGIVHFRNLFCNYLFSVDDLCHWSMCSFVKRFTKKHTFDTVIVNYVYFSRLLKYCGQSKKVIFTHDTFMLKNVRTGQNVFSLRPNGESKGLRRADVILTVQENEKILFQYLAPQKPVYCIYAPFAYKEQAITKKSDILFFSSANKFNIEGIHFFINDVLPHIIKKYPGARLLIGGTMCDYLKDQTLPPYIVLCGKYKNPADFYKQGDIAINPVFHGTGLKIKMIEALSYGKVTVIHEHSSEGIFRKESAPLLIASSAQEFVNLIISALQSVEMRRNYQTKAKEYLDSYNAYIVEQYKKLLYSSDADVYTPPFVQELTMDVSIIIVNYNTKDLLEQCLASVYEHTTGISFEVIVSDNGSKDGSIEMIKERFPQVVLLENNANLGFGRANNRGLDIAHGAYILYLNSDTVLRNNAVKCFFDYWEQHKDTQQLGALGTNLEDQNGIIIHSAGPFKSINTEIKNAAHDLLRSYKLILPVIKDKHLGKEPPPAQKYVGAVDYVTGADLFVKNDAFARYDERYFLYYEDSDLQKTMSLHNKISCLIEGPRIVHIKGQSNTANSPLHFYGSVSKINSFLSSVLFQRKFYNKRVRLLILKGLILLHWLNPALFKKTKKYIKPLLKA